MLALPQLHTCRILSHETSSTVAESFARWTAKLCDWQCAERTAVLCAMVQCWRPCTPWRSVCGPGRRRDGASAAASPHHCNLEQRRTWRAPPTGSTRALRPWRLGRLSPAEGPCPQQLVAHSLDSVYRCTRAIGWLTAAWDPWRAGRLSRPPHQPLLATRPGLSDKPLEAL